MHSQIINNLNEKLLETESTIETLRQWKENLSNEAERNRLAALRNLDGWRKSDAKLEEAKEIIEGLMRFCRCFAQHHTEDIRYKEAEEFLKNN